jgi:hypothetical protein
MVIHTCPRCGYITNNKTNYKTHLLRINKCTPSLLDISIESLIKGLNKIDNYKCDYCDTSFINSQLKYKHKKLCTQNKNNLIKQVSNLTKIVQELQNKNLYQSSIINNQQINNINITIPKLNDFGRENMNAIPETLVSTLFMDLRFRELLANLHCDPNYPENQNVRIKSIKRNTMEIFRNNKWDIMTFSKGLTELILQGHKIFKEYYKKDKDRILKEDMNESEIREVLDQLDEIEKLSKNELKPLLEDLQMMLEEYRENGSAIILA